VAGYIGESGATSQPVMVLTSATTRSTGGAFEREMVLAPENAGMIKVP